MLSASVVIYKNLQRGEKAAYYSAFLRTRRRCDMPYGENVLV